jgi:DNA-binding transcriptional MerR regulator
MNEKRYTVSEAVRLIGVESHVLRYWEEELRIPIERTSLGHRSYSQENVDLFLQVKVLRERGLQMKAIRTWMEETGAGSSGSREADSRWTDNGRTIDNGRTGSRVTDTKWTDNDWSDNRHREDSGDTENRNSSGQMEEGDLWENSEQALPCEVISGEEPSGSLEVFAALLKQMMEEVAQEQDARLEQMMEDCLRDELEELYLQYFQVLSEAAAAKEKETRRHSTGNPSDENCPSRENWLKRILHRLFS